MTHTGLGKQRKGKGPATRKKRNGIRDRIKEEKLEDIRRRKASLR